MPAKSLVPLFLIALSLMLMGVYLNFDSLQKGFSPLGYTEFGGEEVERLYFGLFNGSVESYDGLSWRTACEMRTNVWSLKSYQDVLYIGLNDGSIWAFGGETCYPVGEINDVPFVMETYNGRLYVGTIYGNQNLASYDGQYWNYYELPNTEVKSMLNRNGRLYMGLGNGTLASYDGSWVNHGDHYNAVLSLAEFDGKLYTGLDNGTVVSYDESSWVSHGDHYNSVLSLSEFNGKLYAGLHNGTVVSYDGSGWRKERDSNEIAFRSAVYDGRLYIGFYTGGVLSYDGSSWVNHGAHGVGVFSIERHTINQSATTSTTDTTSSSTTTTPQDTTTTSSTTIIPETTTTSLDNVTTIPFETTTTIPTTTDSTSTTTTIPTTTAPAMNQTPENETTSTTTVLAVNNTPDNATTTSTSTTTSSTTTPASSGGGGGGGSSSRQNSGSTQESEGPDIVSISWPKLTPEFATFWEVSWQTPDTPIGVTEMKILVSREISNVSLSIERLEGPATSGKPSGKVYQYMDISKLNIDDLDISNVTMVFRVSKAWLEENGIDEDSVEISRYSNGWESLPVKRMGQDGEWFYYETSTPGFSVFAIHANQPAGASGTPLTTSTSTSSSTTTTTPIWTSKPKIAKYTILGLSVGLIVLAVLLILKGRKKEGN